MNISVISSLQSLVTKSDITPHYTVENFINPSSLHHFDNHLVDPIIPTSICENNIKDKVFSIPYSSSSQEHEALAKVLSPQDQIVAAKRVEDIDALMSSLPSSTTSSSPPSFYQADKIVPKPIIPSTWES